jgi:hypothetical protein
MSKHNISHQELKIGDLVYFVPVSETGIKYSLQSNTEIGMIVSDAREVFNTSEICIEWIYYKKSDYERNGGLKFYYTLDNARNWRQNYLKLQNALTLE